MNKPMNKPRKRGNGAQRAQPVVVGLLTDQRVAANCRAAYGKAFLLIQRAAELPRCVRRRLVDLVIVEPWDRFGTPVAPMVATMAHRCWPPVLVYLDKREASLRELPRLFRAGVADVVFSGPDDAPMRLRELRNRGALHAVQADALRFATQVIPSEHLPIVRSCFENLREPRSAEALARALGTSKRTVIRQTQRAGFSGIRELTGCCRLAVAVGLILRSGASIEQLALWLGYASAAALCNLLQRYAGVTPAQLALRGDFRYWVERLLTPKARFGGSRALTRLGWASRLVPEEVRTTNQRAAAR